MLVSWIEVVHVLKAGFISAVVYLPVVSYKYRRR
jgi:hypothetical protein